MEPGCRGDGLPPPIAPPELLLTEDDDWPKLASAEAAGDLDPRVELFLEGWMRRLDRRLDRLCEQMSRASRQEPPLMRAPAYGEDRGSASSPQLTPRSPGHEAPDAMLSRSTETDASAGELKSRSNCETQQTRNTSCASLLSWARAPQRVWKVKRQTTKERITDHWQSLEQASISSMARPVVARIVSHKWFDLSITAVVIFSAVMVGVQVDHEAVGDTSNARLFQYSEYVCAGVFTVELVMRVTALGFTGVFSRDERGPFALDSALVLISWFDIGLSLVYTMSGAGESKYVSNIVMVFRVGRLLRVIRTVRFLAELRMMANMILSSFRSLTWLFSILVFLAYTFALVLTQGASKFLHSADADPDIAAQVAKCYGSVILTMYSLFKCMTGGRSWGEIADMIEPAGGMYRMLVVLYVFINLFSVLNIVTGVFVDGAIELGKRDRVVMIQKQGKKRESFARHLVQLLRDMGTSSDGVINREEFLASFSRPEVKEFMQALSIDLDDASNMFSLLDRNGDGTVDIVEFVMGMEKLRGEAKASDIHFLISQCTYMTDLLKRMHGRPVPPSPADARNRHWSKSPCGEAPLSRRLSGFSDAPLQAAMGLLSTIGLREPSKG